MNKKIINDIINKQNKDDFKWDFKSAVFRIENINYIIRSNIHYINSNKILCLSFYNKNLVLEKKNGILFKTFITNNDFINFIYYNNENKYMSFSLKNSFIINSKLAFYKSDDEYRVFNYFNINYIRYKAFDFVKEQQEKILEERLKVRYIKSKENIDEKMLEIVDIPEDFNYWLNNYVFKKGYIFYKNYKGICSICKKKIKLPSIKHGKIINCPNCRNEAILKPIKYLDNFTEIKQAALINKQNKGFVIRYFECKRLFKDIKTIQISYKEIFRDFYLEYGNNFKIKTYMWDLFKDGTEYRWCDKKGRNRIYDSYLYTDNLDNQLNDTFIKYSALKQFAQYKIKFSLYDYINIYYQLPQLEYLVKLKLYNLTNDVIEEMKEYHYKTKIINKLGKTVNEILGINRWHLKIAQSLNCNKYGFGILKEAECLNLNLKKENIILILNNIYYENLNYFLKLLKYVPESKAISYIKQQFEIYDNRYGESYWYKLQKQKEIINDWVYYLNLCCNLRFNLKNKTKYPKYLKEEYTNMKLFVENNKYKIYSDILQKNYENLRNKYYFKYGNLITVIPQSIVDIKNEGTNLNHCVGKGMTYIEKIISEESNIIFIRLSNDINKSFYTVEISENKILQCYGFNHKLPTEEVSEFILEWKNNLESKLYQFNEVI